MLDSLEAAAKGVARWVGVSGGAGWEGTGNRRRKWDGCSSVKLLLTSTLFKIVGRATHTHAERERDRHTHTQTHTHTHTHARTERERHIHTHTHTQTQTDRQTHISKPEKEPMFIANAC